MFILTMNTKSILGLVCIVCIKVGLDREDFFTRSFDVYA